MHTIEMILSCRRCTEKGQGCKVKEHMVVAVGENEKPMTCNQVMLTPGG
jgi:hypothetical protein